MECHPASRVNAVLGLLPVDPYDRAVHGLRNVCTERKAERIKEYTVNPEDGLEIV